MSTSNTEIEVKSVEHTEVSVNASDNENKLVIKTPLFIVFGEYLGYVSDLLEFAENMCKGKEQAKHVVKLLDVEASAMRAQMIKDYSVEDIKKYYNEYYPLFFKEYDENLAKLNDK